MKADDLFKKYWNDPKFSGSSARFRAASGALWAKLSNPRTEDRPHYVPLIERVDDSTVILYGAEGNSGIPLQNHGPRYYGDAEVTYEMEKTVRNWVGRVWDFLREQAANPDQGPDSNLYGMKCSNGTDRGLVLNVTDMHVMSDESGDAWKFTSPFLVKIPSIAALRQIRTGGVGGASIFCENKEGGPDRHTRRQYWAEDWMQQLQNQVNLTVQQVAFGTTVRQNTITERARKINQAMVELSRAGQSLAEQSKELSEHYFSPDNIAKEKIDDYFSEVRGTSHESPSSSTFRSKLFEVNKERELMQKVLGKQGAHPAVVEEWCDQEGRIHPTVSIHRQNDALKHLDCSDFGLPVLDYRPSGYRLRRHDCLLVDVSPNAYNWYHVRDNWDHYRKAVANLGIFLPNPLGLPPVKWNMMEQAAPVFMLDKAH